MYVQLWYYDDYSCIHVQNITYTIKWQQNDCYEQIWLCTCKNMKIITRPPLETFFFALSQLNVQNLSTVGGREFIYFFQCFVRK